MSEIVDVHKVLNDKMSFTGGHLIMNAKDCMEKVSVSFLLFNSGK